MSPNPFLFLKSHQWPTSPLVTLEENVVYGRVIWNQGPSSRSFQAGLVNALVLGVRFRYMNPYGGHAEYKIAIEELIDGIWTTMVYDHAHYFTGRPDDKWYTETKSYTLVKERFGELRFRIIASVRIGGALPTNGGSAGRFEGSSKEFRATFGLTPSLNKDYRELMDQYYQRWKGVYQKRSKTRRRPR